MAHQQEKISENKVPVTSAAIVGATAVQLKDNREYSVVQQKLAERTTKQQTSFTPIQRKTNHTGLPDNLKSGIENLSGHAMDDVKVHYNSDKPAQLNAHAYAQGTDIHLASGQEKHLPHEAWHVVQQKQGRVKPTLQMKGKANVNDDKGLEKEADIMGNKALNIQLKKAGVQIIESNTSIPEVKQLSKISKLPPILSLVLPCGHESQGMIQRMISVNPPKTNKIEVLEKYLYGTSINARKQTFEEAVSGYPSAQIWMENIRNALDKNDINGARQQIMNAIDLVNESETKQPHHPNPVHKGKGGVAKTLALEHEAPYTISKTAFSTTIVNKARKLIISSGELGDDKFMLGLLVLPDGQLIFGISGNKPEMVKLVQKVLKTDSTFHLFKDIVYDKTSISHDDKNTYETDVIAETEKNAAHFAFEEGKVVRKRRENVEDLGSYPANCSAAVALSVAKTVSPKSFISPGKMGLTEVFVSGNSKSEVLIYNKLTAEGDRFTMASEDVPSCHVCQMQLTKVAFDVVTLERQGITDRVRMKIEETRHNIEQSTKELIVLKQQEEQEGALAGQKDGLEKALSEGSKKQSDLEQNLADVEQELQNTTKKLDAVNTDIIIIGDEIDDLNGQEKSWEEKAKSSRHFASKLHNLESQITAFQLKITDLKVEYTALHNAGTGFGWYFTDWHNKIKALQAVKYPKVEAKDMEKRLLTDIEVLEKKENSAQAEKTKIYGANTSSDFKAGAASSDKKKVKISAKIKQKSGTKNEKSGLAKKLSTDQKGLQEQKARILQEIEKVILENTRLEAKLKKSSVAAKELPKIEKQIKKLETMQTKETKELKILKMKQEVYH